MKLIDILNKIANGELKEGTKIKYKISKGSYIMFIMKDGSLKYEKNNYSVTFGLPDLKIECELIEPDHFADVGKMAEHFREDTKMIEPTDNTKIAELDSYYFSMRDATTKCWELYNKLNEVINKVNIHSTVLLAQEKDIEDIKNDLDY
jgi:hypothetical protein